MIWRNTVLNFRKKLYVCSTRSLDDDFLQCFYLEYTQILIHLPLIILWWTHLTFQSDLMPSGGACIYINIKIKLNNLIKTGSCFCCGLSIPLYNLHMYVYASLYKCTNMEKNSTMWKVSVWCTLQIKSQL